MSFSDRERSLADGQAISLYDFRLGPIRWTYTTANRDIEFNNMTFRARPVSDDGRRMTGQASADIMTVTGPSDLEVAQLYRGARPSKAPTLTVWDIHWNEPQGLVVWMGRIDEVNWPADSRVQIKCRLLGTEPRTSISLAWGRECPYTVFDHNCRADREQYRVPFTVELRDGNSVTGAGNAIGGYPDAWFRGGYVEWDSGQGVIEQRGIQQHTGNRLVLVGGTSLLATGTRAVAFPGCDQLIQTCNDKFDNTPNCGAVPFLPGKSPFDGDPWW